MRKVYEARVTTRGRLTLPAGLRRSLSIEPGDQIKIVLKEDHAELRRLEQTVMSVFGSIPTPPGLETGDFDDLIEEAMSDHAAEVVRRMREGLE